MNIDSILEGIQKPARYIGKEHNSIVKKWDKDKIKICIAYPDIYEVGMSYMGLEILYYLLNSFEDVICERVFAPWPDLEKKLRESGTSLFSLETRHKLSEFDIVAFSIAYELTYTNVLNILDIGGIPVKKEDRKVTDPLVIAGGVAVFNPAPMSEFIDLFFIGEAEESLPEFLKIYRQIKKENSPKNEAIRNAHDYIGSAYAPSCGIKTVEKAVVKDFENVFYPEKMIVPYIKTIHDRVPIEIMRGCPNNCSFCQAKNLYHPVRIKTKEKINLLAEKLLNSTGYEEVSFLSLSSANYPHIIDIIDNINQRFKSAGVNVSIPSLRIEDMCSQLPLKLAENRKTAMTFAVEAGSARLRGILNKNIDLDKLYTASLNAFKSGWRRVKLYFMIGLPTETEEDLAGIVEIAGKISMLRKELHGKYGEVILSINNFVPKPHTAFQWLGMAPHDELMRKQEFIKKNCRSRHVKLDFQKIEISFLEGALSRGDQTFSGIIYDAWKQGAKLDAWTEHFQFDIWDKTFGKHNRHIFRECVRGYDIDARLPWDNILVGMNKDILMPIYNSLKNIS